MSEDLGTRNTQRGSAGGKVLGFPLAGFSLFQCLLLTAATGFFVFFLATTLAIFALLAWNLAGRHAVNYAVSYRYIGFPAGVAALASALAYFIVSWVRGKREKG
jgi:hypothetical protein